MSVPSNANTCPGNKSRSVPFTAIIDPVGPSKRLDKPRTLRETKEKQQRKKEIAEGRQKREQRVRITQDRFLSQRLSNQWGTSKYFDKPRTLISKTREQQKREGGRKLKRETAKYKNKAKSQNQFLLQQPSSSQLKMQNLQRARKDRKRHFCPLLSSSFVTYRTIG
jgi:hypothetical protein